MKIVVALDSFKGSASSHELNEAVKAGILSVLPFADVATFDIADGGEGTISALRQRLGGKWVAVETVDLLQRPMIAHYLLTEEFAVIEAADVVGIDKIVPSSTTIQQATTLGLAQVLLDAKKRGMREIIVGLGGTGTSDGGLGLLEGLSGENFTHVRIIGLTDVQNVYAGEKGYAKVFGPQKGGTPEILTVQEKQAQSFVAKIKRERGIDLQAIAGTGAAGGLGGALILLGGKLESGFSKIAHLLKIEEKIKSADLIITGEGKMDAQTAQGKVPFGIAVLAAKYKVPVLAFCGALSKDLGEMDDLLLASFSIQRSVLPLDEAMKKEQTLANMNDLAKNVIKTWQH